MCKRYRIPSAFVKRFCGGVGVLCARKAHGERYSSPWAPLTTLVGKKVGVAMSIHSSTERDEPPDDGAALLSIPDPPQVPVDLVVTRLFPWPTLGQTFLARFKARAATERSIIPDLQRGDVVVCAKGIAELAEELDIAYDTA